MRWISRVAGWIGQLLGWLVKTLILAAILVGIPAGLLTQIGSPLPRTPPSVNQINHLLTTPVTDGLVLDLLADALWIIWVAFVVSLIVEVIATARGIPRPRLGPIAPLQHLASWLVTGVVASVLTASPVLTVAGQAAPAAAATTHVTAATVTTATVPTAGSLPTAATITSVPESSPVILATVALPNAETQTPDAAGQPAVYEVRHGDWLGWIAQRYLGAFDRYPDIQRHNPDLIPNTSGIHGPDHIEPGWRLILPPGAYDHGPQAHATGSLVAGPTTPNNGPASEQDPGGAPTTTGPNATPLPGTAGGPSVTPSAAPTTTPNTDIDPSTTAPATSATPTTATDDSGQPTPADSNDRTDAPQRSRTGATIPGGWVSIPLAAALLAAVTLLWLRRRHRYVPRPLHTGDDDADDLLPPPPVVPRLRRAVREQAPDLLHPDRPEQPTVAQYTTTLDSERPPLPAIGQTGAQLAGLGDPLPAEGLALDGPGAQAAARGLLVATLCSGSPDDPDARGQVVIPADALTTLLGAHAVHVQATPRLHVTATLPEALTLIEETLIERRRTLQDYDAEDPDQMHDADPYHPPMPPVLLIADEPGSDGHARLATTLQLGAPLHINAVLLGDWPDTDRRTVRGDGATSGEQRLTVLDIPTTIQLLTMFHETHTGQPTPTPITEPDVHTPTQTTSKPASERDTPSHDPADIEDDREPDVPFADQPAQKATFELDSDTPVSVADSTLMQPDPSAASPDPPPAEAAPVTAAGPRLPVRVQVLGEPAVHHADGSTDTGLRQHSRELLVYLAVHRNGADLTDIMEIMWPTATVRRAGERLSTETADLRRRIRDAADDYTNIKDKRQPSQKPIQPIINSGSRYHLNPAIVDVDLWHLDDALRDAAATTDPATRAAALRRAIDAHTGLLAENHDYDWLDQPREHARRQGIRARIHFADLIHSDDPQQAAQLYQAAADLDPVNEDIARRAMRAHAAAGEIVGVRTRLHQLRVALDAIDEEPSPETLSLAVELERDLERHARANPSIRQRHA
ncbi:LysM peptidoglycan-binding domain-containing protein [Rugosimonospora africana]|uniref:Bacterial transcriptional activator domain-containing protein n=1 Tax=Rugosimonospora africana TaxID=556532 RepID=A0A8J3VS24_9ACTN|nr:LysM domain-containing protein [Rugosimonospora africana]GIH16106.1 hypothetical protein Raf01_42780 [Rugosimonospora africana]